nr:hypothetical protein [uncultured Devosia sp.]
MLTRSDFILVALALPLILWARGGKGGQIVSATLVGGLASALTFMRPLLALGLTPLDVVAVVRHSVELWAREPLPEIPLREALVFAGAAGLLLLPLGLVSTARHANWPLRLLLLGVPLLFVLIYGSRLWQARQFLPILPFMAALVAAGTGALWRHLPSQLGRAIACLLLAFFWLWPGPVVFSDGPRLLTGQFWSPLVWHDWQKQVRDQLAIIDDEVAGGGVIITDEWSMDRYTHLSFRENGWTPMAGTACGPYVEVWNKDGQTAWHARLGMPLIVGPERAMPALLEDLLSQCLPAIGPTALRHLAVTASTPSGDLPGFLLTPPYWAVAATDLDLAGLDVLLDTYRDEAGDDALTADGVATETSRLESITPLLR